MGRFANLLGTVLGTFGVGPKGARATLDVSELTADRTHTLPDRSGPVAIGEQLAYVADPASTSSVDIYETVTNLLSALQTSGLMAGAPPLPMGIEADYPDAIIGVAYSYAPTLTGEYILPVTFSIASGAIPVGAGWTFDAATGELSNPNPATTESATFVVRATDSTSPTPQTADSLSQTMEVAEPSGVPQLVNITPNATVSNGGRSMSHNGGAGTYAHALTDVPVSGKQYVEVEVVINSNGMCTGNLYGGNAPLNVEIPLGQWFGQPGAMAGFSDQFALALRANSGLPGEVQDGSFRLLPGGLPSAHTVCFAIDADTREVWVCTVADPTWYGGGDPEAGTSPSFVLGGTDPIVVGVSNAAPDRVGTLRLASENELATPAGFTNYMQD